MTLAITARTGIPGNATWTQKGRPYRLASPSSEPARFLEYVSCRRAGNLSYLGGGFVGVEVNAADRKGTPFDRRLRLGGGGQLGTGSPMFVEMNLHSI